MRVRTGLLARIDEGLLPHAKEEEKTMFKMAREMFSAEERADMDVQYEERKQSGAGRSAVAKASAAAGAANVLGQLANLPARSS